VTRCARDGLQKDHFVGVCFSHQFIYLAKGSMLCEPWRTGIRPTDPGGDGAIVVSAPCGEQIGSLEINESLLNLFSVGGR
jgi:hypothetical protein